MRGFTVPTVQAGLGFPQVHGAGTGTVLSTAC